MFTMVGRIVLVCMIFRKAGGKRKRANLEALELCDTGNVQMLGSEKGNVNKELWPQILEMFAQRTRHERGIVGEDGVSDWKYAIVLYVDSYGVHLNKKVAARFASDYGIFLRFLLRNSSHIMQAIDRHIGQCLKLLYAGSVMEYNYALLHMLKMPGFTENMAVQKYTELCAAAIQRAVVQVCLSVFALICIGLHWLVLVGVGWCWLVLVGVGWCGLVETGRDWM